MSKGLYHCSKCKKHFYDHDATAMHIKDAHGGNGKVLRHPTKRELLIRDEQQRSIIEQQAAEIASLRAKVDRLTDALESIDAVAVDHGYYETAARTMQETARNAVHKTSKVKHD